MCAQLALADGLAHVEAALDSAVLLLAPDTHTTWVGSSGRRL